MAAPDEKRTGEAEHKQRCGAPITITTSLGGGARQVSGCQRLAVEDGHCAEHAAERRHWKRQFEDSMAKASRHFKHVVYRHEGRRGWQCVGCKVFVADDEQHPWDVPESQVATWWADHPTAPHRPDGAKPLTSARIKGDGYDVTMCLSEPLTADEKAALHEFFRTSALGRKESPDGH